MSINTVTAQPRNKFGDLGKEKSQSLSLSLISHISIGAFIFQNQSNLYETLNYFYDNLPHPLPILKYILYTYNLHLSLFV